MYARTNQRIEHLNCIYDGMEAAGANDEFLHIVNRVHHELRILQK